MTESQAYHSPEDKVASSRRRGLWIGWSVIALLSANLLVAMRPPPGEVYRWSCRRSGAELVFDPSDLVHPASLFTHEPIPVEDCLWLLVQPQLPAPWIPWNWLAAALARPAPDPNTILASLQQPENDAAIDLRSDDLATPLVLTHDGVQKAITCLEIRGTLPGKGDGEGTITLHEDRLRFNDFGDVTERLAKSAQTCTVVFRHVRLRDYTNDRDRWLGYPWLKRRGDKRRLYYIECAQAFARPLRLVFSTGHLPHRLLVQPEDKLAPELVPGRILDLHGVPEVKNPLPNAPLGANMRLTGITPFHERPLDDLRRVYIFHTPNGAGRLDFDPNHLEFDLLGNVIGSTLMAGPELPVKFNRMDVADPKYSSPEEREHFRGAMLSGPIPSSHIIQGLNPPRKHG